MTPEGLEKIYEFEVLDGFALYKGKKIDLFDIVDALHGSDSRLFLHDVECRKRNRPQLDLIQDLSLEVGIWYDGCFRTADSTIDPLVAGAEMVVIDPAYMKSITEFEHVMRLTSNVIIDLLSEHEDRVHDFNNRMTTPAGLSRILGLGYLNYLIAPDDLAALAEAFGGKNAMVWIRTDQPWKTSGSFTAGLKIAGTVRSLSELVIEDEH